MLMKADVRGVIERRLATAEAASHAAEAGGRRASKDRERPSDRYRR
jgi:hypothetical protein